MQVESFHSIHLHLILWKYRTLSEYGGLSLTDILDLGHLITFMVKQANHLPPRISYYKKTLSAQASLRSVPRVSLMHIPYFILYDLTSVRRHLEFRSEHFTRTAAHEHAL